MKIFGPFHFPYWKAEFIALSNTKLSPSLQIPSTTTACDASSLEKTLESLLACKEIQPVHSKGDQPWVFFGRDDAKAETPVFWPSHAKSWLIEKDSDAGRDWGQEEKGMTEDEMAEWHHRLDGHEVEWTPGVGDGQGGLVCCDSWGRKELDTTERLNWAEATRELPLRVLNFKGSSDSGDDVIWIRDLQYSVWSN